MKTFSANNICQSCGLPMYHLSDFGTNEDDTINTDYCHFCFIKGIFIDHGISLEQKI
ncbi:zinc ribbon domain-containing protein [Maribacter sp. 4G9]|uniref:zinc ribbon domain-containing protein n=1 Tax=Maribacter sp. 4G9 TaxID=1889777 RepID=UPI000C159E23